MGRHASLARICALASRLERMEQAAGIGSLSHLERKVLRAAFAASNSENIFSPVEVLEMLRGEDGVSRSFFSFTQSFVCRWLSN